MGCGQSKIEHEEVVARCRERKDWMKKAVSSRNAFAAAHSGYTVSLKNTGAALSDYAHGEAHHIIPASSAAHHHASSSSSSSAAPSAAAESVLTSPAAATVVQPPIDAPLPPPPPPVDFTPPPLMRAASMPDLPVPKKQTARKPPAAASIREDEDDDNDGEDADDEEEDGDKTSRIEHRRRRSKNNHDGDDVHASNPPPPPPVGVAAQQPQRQRPPPPPPLVGSGFGDYIFDTTNMPIPSLSQPELEEVPPPVSTRTDIDHHSTEIPQEKVVTERSGPPPPVVQPEQQQQRPPPTPKPMKKPKSVHTSASATGESKKGGMVAHTGQTLNLFQVFNDLDDHFLKASESAHEVSKMLEAARMHYHSNFADNRGHIDHSARVMRVITWNRSCKAMKDGNDEKDEFDNEELETHAAILDKMLAWEKKLYDEVKAGEIMKIEYQRKVALLNKQKKRGASPETLEKTKAVVSHLHTRYIVDMQSMDSTVSEINRLRDKQLYSKLVELVDGMEKMWETMYTHHSNQLKIAREFKKFDVSLAPKETNEQHHERTHQLWQVLREWHSQFQNLMKNQKEYIQALNSWLKLNLVPIESNLKEKVSSPPRVVHPAIQPLLLAWHDLLEKLQDDRARVVIHTFAEVVNTILIIQDDELKLKEKCEDAQREYVRRKRAFDDWKLKYLDKKAAAEAAAAAAAADTEGAASVADPEGRETANQEDEIVAERRAVVESLKIKLKAEEEDYQRMCKQVREKSVGCLKTHLPELFAAMSEFAHECSKMYKSLRSLTMGTQENV